MKRFYQNEKTIISIKGKELANIEDVIDFLCVGGEIEFGVAYELIEGAIVFELDEEGGDIGYTVARLDNDDKG